MNTYRRILRMPDGDGGTSGTPGMKAGDGPAGGTPPLNDFVKSLPADLQAEKSLHSIPDAVTLAKSYVHAQKLIGTKRLPVPEATWDDKAWSEFADQIGRPKTAADYKVPEFKFESKPDLKLDDGRMTDVKSALHEAGLTQRQADKVLTTYFRQVDQDLKGAAEATRNTRAVAEQALKDEWKDKYDSNVDLAKSVVTKFADPELMSYIAEGGGNDPRLIKTLARIGAAMLDDNSRGGSAANGLQVTDVTKATQEIDRLKMDKDFLTALTKKDHPGHRAAVTQWTNLHRIAAPGKQVEPS